MKTPRVSEKKSIQARIVQDGNFGDGFYIGECIDLTIVTQGKTLDEVDRNIQEAVALHLEGEDLAELGLAEELTLQIKIELERLVRQS